MPAVIGILRPSVVLPLDAASWTAERLRVVLLHECAHVRRRDAMLQVVANVVGGIVAGSLIVSLDPDRTIEKGLLKGRQYNLADPAYRMTFQEEFTYETRPVRVVFRPGAAVTATAGAATGIVDLTPVAPAACSRAAPNYF